MAKPSLSHQSLTPLNVNGGQPSNMTVNASPNIGPPPAVILTITLTVSSNKAYFIENGVHVDHIVRTFPSQGNYSILPYTVDFVIDSSNKPATVNVIATATNHEPSTSDTKGRSININ